MKIKWLIIASASWLCAFVIWLNVYFGKVQAASPTRFERISDEHFDPSFNHAVIFEVWHDKDSGQEITCVGSRDTNNTGGLDGKAWPISCFPSGRNWRKP